MRLYLFFEIDRYTDYTSFEPLSYFVTDKEINSNNILLYSMLGNHDLRVSSVRYTKLDGKCAFMEIESKESIKEFWVIIGGNGGKYAESQIVLNDLEVKRVMYERMKKCGMIDGEFNIGYYTDESMYCKHKYSSNERLLAYKVNLSELREVAEQELYDINYFMMVIDKHNKCVGYSCDEFTLRDYIKLTIGFNPNLYYVIRRNKHIKIYVRKVVTPYGSKFSSISSSDRDELKLENFITKEMYAREVLLRG